MPDNPTGRLARPGTVRTLCDVAAENDLTIICDEIYRDLVHDPAADVLSPAAVAPRRTVVTTALSKSLALGGWRIGAARLPDGPHGDGLRDRLLGIVSEIWSAPSAPVQQAAAYAFGEPAEITERVTRSRGLHAAIARAVADRCVTAGLLVPAPQAAFYLYPDFEPWREHLRASRRISTDRQRPADPAVDLRRPHPDRGDPRRPGSPVPANGEPHLRGTDLTGDAAEAAAQHAAGGQPGGNSSQPNPHASPHTRATSGRP